MTKPDLEDALRKMDKSVSGSVATLQVRLFKANREKNEQLKLARWLDDWKANNKDNNEMLTSPPENGHHRKNRPGVPGYITWDLLRWPLQRLFKGRRTASAW